MDENLYRKVKEYRTAMAVIREMLTGGLITNSDYAVICTVLAEKTGLKSSTIFSDIDLISMGNNGNIVTAKEVAAWKEPSKK